MIVLIVLYRIKERCIVDLAGMGHETGKGKKRWQDKSRKVRTGGLEANALQTNDTAQGAFGQHTLRQRPEAQNFAVFYTLRHRR